MSGPVDGAPPPPSRGPVEGRRHHSLFHHHHDDEDAPGAWCPQCGGEFRAGVTWCDDCGVPLTTEQAREPEADVPAEVPSDRHDVVEYDLSAWTDEQVSEIESQLQIDEVPHEWQDRTLRAPGQQEARLDALIDALDELDEVPDDVEYEFQEWTPQQCEQLVNRLLELGIGCRWDGYLLAIGAADEATVDAEVLQIDPTFPVT